jgi:hypothetical protein
MPVGLGFFAEFCIVISMARAISFNLLEESPKGLMTLLIPSNTQPLFSVQIYTKLHRVA